MQDKGYMISMKEKLAEVKRFYKNSRTLQTVRLAA